jgi:hypothetical protein
MTAARPDLEGAFCTEVWVADDVSYGVFGPVTVPGGGCPTSSVADLALGIVGRLRLLLGRLLPARLLLGGIDLLIAEAAVLEEWRRRFEAVPTDRAPSTFLGR